MAPPPDLAATMTRITGFVQQVPEDGVPASQRTEVYLGYDERSFYAVFLCFDEEPDRVRAHLGRRERVFGDETIEIQLDTFHDRRRAFSFLTNPFGVQWDAIWTEGRGFDASWDTVWTSRGRLTERGYVVLMAIPFKSLRFRPEDTERWGLVFVRDIPRNNEVSFWPRVSNRIEGRLNQAADLLGLSGISPGRNFQVNPYGAARSARVFDVDADATRSDSESDAGLDAKLVFADRFTLDLTANPDFSQVESDLPQVTVNQRFEVFFPETRPFFLENAPFFETPFTLLFTRRVADPGGGGRFTGRAGKWALGALLADDRRPGDDAVNGVLRASRDVGSQSNVGWFYSDREVGDRRNRVGAFDGRIKLDDHWVTRFQAVRTSLHEAGVRRADDAWQVELNRQGRHLTTHLHYLDVGPDVVTDLGFVNRVDYRNLHGNLDYDFRPEGKWLVRWGPSLSLLHLEDQAGVRLDASATAQIEFELRRQTDFGFFHTRGRERLRAQDLEVPGPADGLDFEVPRRGFFFNTRFFPSWTLSTDYTEGDAINFLPPPGENPGPAWVGSHGASATLRPGKRLRIDLRWLSTRLATERGGARIFTNRIARSRFDYQITPRLSLRFIFRYDSNRPRPERTRLARSRNLNADFLVTYLVHPGTALYAGYNSNHRTDEAIAATLSGADGRLLNDSAEAFVKLSYLYRF